jgi:parallel beta-helix repeat protein
MKKVGIWSARIVGGLLGICILSFVLMGLGAVPEDEPMSPGDYGAGASSVAPSYTGLERAFPEINGTHDPAQAELGRLLFFDPVLSADNDMSCATCHHPDLGFADGLPYAIGAGGAGSGSDRTGGVVLSRGAPTLWNVGYNKLLFWDGREHSLEAQAEIPLTHPDEMGVSDTTALMAELQAIPEYAALFTTAFADGEVSLANVSSALAAFQRTLISNDSAFDRFAAGDRNAFTPAQRRGLTLFRSAALRCFECHAAPTFATDTLRIVGAPDDNQDLGAGHNEFKVPTLRNVALTAPYMHNGAFATLEEVVDFYAAGGGNAFGVAEVDSFVAGFDLTDQEKNDLIAFMIGLTDTAEWALNGNGSSLIPLSVPSGLPVVARMDHPLRALAVAAGPAEGPPPARAAMTFDVFPDQIVQEIVDLAQPGDTIQIHPGVYHQRVVVDVNELTILGVAGADGEWPTFDGQGELTEAIIASGNDFEVGNLNVLNYVSNGILVEGVTGVYVHHTFVQDTGVYGIYPVQSTDVLVEFNEVSGANDAGIYTGQCVDVIVRENEVYGNVLGIEIENTVNAEVYNNYSHDNTMGIFIDLLPQLSSKVSLNTKVYDNLVENNNLGNFARLGTSAALAPPGTGIAILSADHVEIYNNIIKGNKSTGIGVFHMNVGFDDDRINVPANPEHNFIHDNVFENNGYDPDAFVTDLGIPGADILWDGNGINNRFDQPGATSFPPLLPTSSWPDLAYNALWRLLNFLTGLL